MRRGIKKAFTWQRTEWLEWFAERTFSVSLVNQFLFIGALLQILSCKTQDNFSWNCLDYLTIFICPAEHCHDRNGWEIQDLQVSLKQEMRGGDFQWGTCLGGYSHQNKVGKTCVSVCLQRIAWYHSTVVRSGAVYFFKVVHGAIQCGFSPFKCMGWQ